MIHPLEYKSELATFKRSVNEMFDSDDVAIAEGETITCCAWCDENKLMTRQLQKSGYKVSHGICKKVIHSPLLYEPSISDAETMTDEEHADYNRARTSQIRNENS
jgi:hypothetical protein